ncbi:MAG: ribosome silencing factor [Erysipelothrix sp.]|nr:ribosome silencing factor [Erysipelothrix sp.]
MNNLILEKTIKVLQDKLAKEINIIDFQKENPFTDYFVICETGSQRQIDAVLSGFNELRKKEEIEIRDIDGKASSGWVAIDLYDVVVHVFDKETRNHYEIDKLFYKYPQKMVKEDVSDLS